MQIHWRTQLEQGWGYGKRAVPLGILHLHPVLPVPPTLQAHRVLLMLYRPQIDIWFLLGRSGGAKSQECSWGSETAASHGSPFFSVQFK